MGGREDGAEGKEEGIGLQTEGRAWGSILGWGEHSGFQEMEGWFGGEAWQEMRQWGTRAEPPRACKPWYL
jgi:hypothetical protein